MKRLIPLLLLLPSVALIIHARRGIDNAAVERHRVEFVISAGDFRLPDGHSFQVWRNEMDGELPNFADVVDGRAVLAYERAGVFAVSVHLCRATADTASKMSLGVFQSVEINVARGDKPQLETLVISPKECEAALAKHKTAR